MQKALLMKAVLVGVIFLLLLIPLRMIDGIVAERSARQQAVVQEIATSNYGRQVLAGLILSVPYVEEYDEVVIGADKARTLKRCSVERVAHFFPSSSDILGTATVETKSRGLFKARVFSWNGSARGEFVFDGKPVIERTSRNSQITWGKPTLNLALSDPRGLIGQPVLQWSGQQVTLERGSGLPHLASGLHADVAEFDPAKPQHFIYALTIGLHGTESLSIVPLAGNDKVTLYSDWAHPSFGGQFLPQPGSQRETKDGFDAKWATTALASKAQQQMLAMLEGRGETRDIALADRLEVRFIEPIDIYSLSDRALKYGFLFVGLTFGCFFLFEIMKTLPIHPAQYGLVGLALATFFLLLIGLSEHIAFGIAYAIASTASIALLGFYLSAALQGIKRGLSFAAMLSALYGALYGLLISEDNALLLGSVLVFALVAAAMVLTRKLDWYALGGRGVVMQR